MMDKMKYSINKKLNDNEDKMINDVQVTIDLQVLRNRIMDWFLKESKRR